MTLSETMDPALTLLMRAAVLITGPNPDLPAIARMIVASTQTLEASRITLQHCERIRDLQPPPGGMAGVVVDLSAVRTARGVVQQ